MRVVDQVWKRVHYDKFYIGSNGRSDRKNVYVKSMGQVDRVDEIQDI